jgi:hypothetical protein
MDTTGKCLLCLANEPNKKNSHIVPKFLTKGLFSVEHYRKTLTVHKTGKSRYHQDTPKEDFILCEGCEKRIEIVETTLAPVIRGIHDYENLPSEFEHVVRGQMEYLRCVKVQGALFYLFFYSIVWRLSVSKLESYGTFKLPVEVEENIRIFLNKNLGLTKGELETKIVDEIIIPNYYMVLIKPKIKTDPPGGMLSAHSYNEAEHLVTLVDFILFFFVNEHVINASLKVISNNLNSVFLIGMGDNKHWLELNSSLYHQVLKGGKSTK